MFVENQRRRSKLPCLGISNHNFSFPAGRHAAPTKLHTPSHMRPMSLAAAAPRSIARQLIAALSHQACNATGHLVKKGRQQAPMATTRTTFSGTASLRSSSDSSGFQSTPKIQKSAVGVEERWDDAPAYSVAPKADKNCIVNSHTEWDPLEEVIVGRVDGATIPEWHVSGKAVWPAKHWDMFRAQAGQPFRPDLAQEGRWAR